MECYAQGIYRPRDAQATALYHLVEDNFDELERVWDDRYEKQLQSLVNSGQLALKQPAPAQGGRGGRGGAGQSARLWSANAHYLIGPGCLGLGDAAKAKAELAQAVEISPDLLGRQDRAGRIEVEFTRLAHCYVTMTTPTGHRGSLLCSAFPVQSA